MKTRIAPSPTGLFHLGTARTAYYCYLAARASLNGKFIVRIDDTDIKRNKPEYIRLIFDALDWLGLDYDGVEYQSKRGEQHGYQAGRLVNQGLAYQDDEGAVRLSSVDLDDTFEDYVGGTLKVSQQDRYIAQNMVLMRSDGSPTYHLASVVDDLDMSVTLVLRGKDHISNTARHIALGRALNKTYLGTSVPQYGHVGLILKDGKKLSKRDTAADLMEYRRNGYSPEAVLNLLLRMGWSAQDPEFDRKHPLIPKEMASEIFLTAGKMRPVNSKFDQAKLDWYNKKYQRRPHGNHSTT